MKKDGYESNRLFSTKFALRASEILLRKVKYALRVKFGCAEWENFTIPEGNYFTCGVAGYFTKNLETRIAHWFQTASKEAGFLFCLRMV